MSYEDTFTFDPITGPTYTFRYETTEYVDSGCGGAILETTGSTLTLTGTE